MQEVIEIENSIEAENIESLDEDLGETATDKDVKKNKKKLAAYIKRQPSFPWYTVIFYLSN